jgi:simple sugar transport system ATP-binding protein
MGNANTAGRQETAAPAIELRGISKAFGPVQANKDISIRVMPGTIHGIIGENGAGKSTLMSILFGYYKQTLVKFLSAVKKHKYPIVRQQSPQASEWYFNTLNWFRTFTVLENVILGAEDGALLNTVPSQCARNIAPIGPRIRA